MFDEKLVLQIAKDMGIQVVDGAGHTFVDGQRSTYIKELEVELNQKKKHNTKPTTEFLSRI